MLNQIKARAYERSLAQRKTDNFPAVLPEYLAEQAEEALKSSSDLASDPDLPEMEAIGDAVVNCRESWR
ncbi:MAG TPA: hypothetical protein VEG60_18710 [Candidatus Binatia bacterium]|nr:hypothetical protein [Candidatus Binatia bacterium]